MVERRGELLADLSKMSSEHTSDGHVQDSGDEALALTMEKLADSLLQTEIDEINLISDAIARIEKGEFGFCIDCEEQISEKRLETFPYAARCIVCQELFEK